MSEITKNTKIIALLEDYSCCAQYRIIRPFTYLKEKCGYSNLYFTPYPNDILKQINLFDIFIIQRPNFNKKQCLEAILNSGKKVFTETDDALEHIPSHNPAITVYTRDVAKDFINLIQKSDGLITSTKVIKNNYLNINSNVEVWENCIDFSFRDWTPLSEELRNNEKIIIGWMGSASHMLDIEPMALALSQIMEKYHNVYFKFNGQIGFYEHICKKFKFPFERCIFVPLQEFDKYVESMKEYDIGTGPLINDVFNRCKSDIKLQEYSALSIPYIASNVGPYKEHYDRYKDGIVVENDIYEWYNKLEYLIINENERQNMGMKARENCLENCSLENGRAEKYIETINKLINNENINKNKIIINGKVGRNDDCPCGSGKKYKKCCLR
jgi:glycosyltransferase involved in cell wall biosynthesis